MYIITLLHIRIYFRNRYLFLKALHEFKLNSKFYDC